MLLSRTTLLLFSLISMQVYAMESNSAKIDPPIESNMQISQVYLNGVVVKFKSTSPYERISLELLGQKMTLDSNNDKNVFQQRLLIDPTKDLDVSYELFPGEYDFGLKMVNKSKFKENGIYNLIVNIGDRAPYAVMIDLKKQ